ncbi:MAG: Wzz/FepE/Etk N-terminal domain-containing protein, partial [Myxococcota bacterium]|nr:Wzz/FepE/Etk N-terminal domain-containing protein [Myxococcota bacterium]
MTPPSQVGAPGPYAVADDDDVDLRTYLYTLVDSRWLIAAVTAVCLVLALGYAFVATPIYRTDTLLQVEEKTGGMAGLAEVSALFTGETPSETEIEIIRSRLLVGRVVEELALDLEVQPKRFPIFGGPVARRWKGNEPRPPALWLSSYAWGGEKLRVGRLTVASELENQKLTLVAGKEGSFELQGPDGDVALKGKVGQAVSSEDGSLQLFVTELQANEGARFEVTKRNRHETIARIQEQLVVRERGKKTGILQVTLEGPDPKRIAGTLDSLASAYLKQNVDRKSEEAERTLEFLSSQLPLLRTNLEHAEQELNAYRSTKGTVDLSREAEALLERTVQVETGMTQLDIQHADLKQRFTESHPKLAALRQQSSQLRAEREVIESKLKELPEAELKSARYMRDVKVANELYVLLLNKAQELKVMKSGTIGNVRILDAAIIANRPVAPKKSIIAVLGLLLGLSAGAALVLVRKALNSGVEDPNEIEKSLGLPVYATVPHSEFQAQQAREVERGKGKTLPVLAAAQTADVAVESIRSLRTALQFALMDGKNPVVAIGGPSPFIGKSFISVNLAQVVAVGGKRV